MPKTWPKGPQKTFKLETFHTPNSWVDMSTVRNEIVLMIYLDIWSSKLLLLKASKEVYIICLVLKNSVKVQKIRFGISCLVNPEVPDFQTCLKTFWVFDNVFSFWKTGIIFLLEACRVRCITNNIKYIFKFELH